MTIQVAITPVQIVQVLHVPIHLHPEVLQAVVAVAVAVAEVVCRGRPGRSEF